MPTKAPGPRLAYSMKEAADSIGVSRGHVYNLIASGDLSCVMAGSRRLVRVADLEEFLDKAASK